MSRPKKCRKVCKMPISQMFRPSNIASDRVILSVDEYECIRLVDHEGFSQEQCADFMGVSRATAQLICDTARKKIATALVKSSEIYINGGDYRLCDGQEENCGCGGCKKHYLNKFNLNEKNEKGDNFMRIAVTYENEEIFQHFGHTKQFKIYDVQGADITAKSIVDTEGHGHGALASFLKNLQVDVLICGGIGGGAQNALGNADIKLFGGVQGLCDDAVSAYIKGELNFNPDVKCNHHGHSHDHGHSCGDHGCGSHTCGKNGCH